MELKLQMPSAGSTALPLKTRDRFPAAILKLWAYNTRHILGKMRLMKTAFPGDVRPNSKLMFQVERGRPVIFIHQRASELHCIGRRTKYFASNAAGKCTGWILRDCIRNAERRRVNLYSWQPSGSIRCCHSLVSLDPRTSEGGGMSLKPTPRSSCRYLQP